MKMLMSVVAAAALLAACGGSDGQAQPKAPPTAAASSPETKPPNAPNQKPAFPGQTRAPEMKADVQLAVTDYVTGVEEPWALKFLPNGALLMSEQRGRLRIFQNGQLSPPVAGLPEVDARNQGGLLGLALDPNHETNGLIYWAYAENRNGLTNTAVARGRLVSAPGQPPRLENVQVIWRQTPAMDSTMHYGARLVFARDGTLFITTGERSITEGRMQAERLDGTLGKVVRINADGSIPKDNPFASQAGARPEIYSIGHRNIQAAALNPRTGELWVVEHGARGGDELNIVRKGRNYGWPTVAYGVEYRGGQITGDITRKEGTEQPIYYWDPVIAPSGMAFYDADLVPEWKDSLFVGGLAPKYLARLTLDGDRVVGEERLLTDLGERIRDVIVGPDGALYVATDNEQGRVLRIAPVR